MPLLSLKKKRNWNLGKTLKRTSSHIKEFHLFEWVLHLFRIKPRLTVVVHTAHRDEFSANGWGRVSQTVKSKGYLELMEGIILPLEISGYQKKLVDTCTFKRLVSESSVLFSDVKSHSEFGFKLIEMNPLEPKVIIWKSCYADKYFRILNYSVSSQLTELECSAKHIPFVNAHLNVFAKMQRIHIVGLPSGFSLNQIKSLLQSRINVDLRANSEYPFNFSNESEALLK
ncbi:unnamed protein product [Ambrosiozyma monospora]|uniref:Unnamed protein product n=1 Tax=Ambrosiozyma monospora TaxID=43982 RepID=A0ACB5T138_AMBMO|nr:unnamed protein product [Ambrosiozyma monospora]